MPNTSEARRQALEALFKGDAEVLALYGTLEQAVLSRWPEVDIRVQKTQVSFYNRHLFAAAWPPTRRVKGWPKTYLGVTVGLARPIEDARAVQVVEPYPGRFTNHILVEDSAQVDTQLMDWVAEAYAFSMAK